jgi:plastocyanin
MLNYTLNIQNRQHAFLEGCVQIWGKFPDRRGVRHAHVPNGAARPRAASGDIGPGQNYTLKLDEPGAYPYYCIFHSDKGQVDIAGTIVVEP